MVIMVGGTRTDHIEGEEIYLNLNKTDLIGFHRSVSKKKVFSLIDSIKEGKEINPVYVVKNQRGFYEMALLIDPKQGKIDGGHHGAYAHYLINQELKCKSVSEEWKSPICEVNIRDMIYRPGY